MKTVGKQLQEARLAKNWTPELASRETKIKVDRLRDLEGDDYSHFTSPTYARGFVRTYARALGMDEYRILRQLDNKLPEDDSSNIATETGVAYLPETSLPPRAAHRDYTGLYVVMALGAVVTVAIVFVLFEAYRVGELSNWFASSPEPAAASTNAAPAISTTDTTARALPVDSNTPPPIVDASSTTNTTNPTNGTNVVAEAAPGTASPPRALPVAPSVPDANTNSAPGTDAPVQAVRALPVDPSELTNAPAAAAPGPPPQAASSDTTNSPAQNAPKAPPRALPVSPAELAAASSNVSAAPVAATTVALNTPPSTAPDAAPAPPPAHAAPARAGNRPSNGGPVMEPSLPPVEPSTVPAPAASTPSTASAASTNAAPSTAADKRLVLTASQDSFVRVTKLDAAEAEPLYAAVLHSGQSVGFDGRKFSINVGVPAAVDIKLDGVNYGPHSDQQAPETFTVESHLP